MGSDLIQGSKNLSNENVKSLWCKFWGVIWSKGKKKYGMIFLIDLEVKMGSDLIQGSKKKKNGNAKWLGSKIGKWFDLMVKEIFNEIAKWLGT
jgi:hypothetical protein